MVQVKAHQGYFQSDGRFIFNNTLVKLPMNKKVTVLWEDETIEDEPKSKEHRLIPKQREVVLQVIENLKIINKEPIDKKTQVSFDAFDRGEFRVKFSNRLDNRYDEFFNEVQA